MTETIVALALLTQSVVGVQAAPWCGNAWVTGYVRGAGNAHTYDGTSIWTDEPIAAASWDVNMGANVWVDGLGTYRVADRGGGLGYGSPTHIDIAVWSVQEAWAITGERWICISR